MSKINITSNEFSDIVVSFLFDKMLHPDEVSPDNDNFNKLIENMRGKGLKSLFMNYYLKMDSNMRVKYKRIKDTFDDTNKSSIINIKPEKAKGDIQEPEKRGLLKRVIGKILSHSELEDDEREYITEHMEKLDGGE